MNEVINKNINENEYLYRGIIEINWDFENNRPSSATFKDSKGISVDRDNFRTETECLEYMQSSKKFFAICKIKTLKVVELNAVVKYKPTNLNIYHSEIHDSENKIQIQGSKSKKLRDYSTTIFISN